MDAITIRNGTLAFVADHAEPTVGTDDSLIRVSQAGICETDLQLARGYMDFEGVLGHEFVGVAQTGPMAGRRVVGEINCNCRDCPRCQSGLGNHCQFRTVVGIDRHDGAFARHVAIPHHNLHAIPDRIGDDEAVLVEPIAAAFQILEQVETAASDRVTILGDGRLAYFCAQTLASVVERVRVVGKHPEKLNRFSRIGMETVLHDRCEADRSADIVVDCTGSASGLPMALGLVRPRGTVVMKTTIAGEHQMSLAPIVIDEIRLIGSRCGPFAKAIEALDTGLIDVSGLITHRFHLDEAKLAFETASRPDAFKVVFEIGNEGQG